jgi:hypothetical protein
MSGARQSKFMICVSLARVTCSRRANDAEVGRIPRNALDALDATHLIDNVMANLFLQVWREAN